MNAYLQPTPLGTVVILWDGPPRRPVVRRIFLPRAGGSSLGRRRQVAPASVRVSCPRIAALGKSLAADLAGRPRRIPRALLALDTCPPFQRAVLRATGRIPRGQVRTYGQLAAQLGRPGAARAVGNALAANPFPLAIPCHRVVRAGGRLGGFGGGTALKRALLAREGVACAAPSRRSDDMKPGCPAPERKPA